MEYNTNLKCILSICLLIFFNTTGLVALDMADGPDFSNPENSARYTVGDLPPTLQWSDVPTADSYEVEFALNRIFSEPFSIYSDINELDFSDLLTQETWDQLSIQLYCHVRGLLNDSPITEWSDAIEFAKSIHGNTEILSPVDDARFSAGELLPVFKWGEIENIDEYVIEFSLDQDFIDTLGSFSLQGTEVDCNTGGNSEIWDLLSGTFYWRVWGLEGALQVPTPYSDTVVFSKTVEPPTTLLTPSDKTRFNGTATLPTFTWEPLPNQSPEYHIQFAYGSAGFPAGGAYISTAGTSFSFSSVQGITQELWNQFYGKLSWRVAGIDCQGNHGAFSNAFSFVKVSDSNYMAYGDSITGGYGASNWGTGYAGYPPVLQDMLRSRFSNQINVFCQQGFSWFPGGHAYTGDAKTDLAMEYHGPGKVLIMFGIIDVVDPGAEGCEDHECFTIEHLTNVITKIRSYNSTPYIATVTPINPDSDKADLQDVIQELNVDIRNLAEAQSVPLCDLEAIFENAPLQLPEYYAFDEEDEEADWAHFNDLGYQLIAEAWNEIL